MTSRGSESFSSAYGCQNSRPKYCAISHAELSYSAVGVPRAVVSIEVDVAVTDEGMADLYIDQSLELYVRFADKASRHWLTRRSTTHGEEPDFDGLIGEFRNVDT